MNGHTVKRTNGQTDKRTNVPCVLQDIVPFGAAAQKAHYLGDFLIFSLLGAIWGPLEGPLGATVIYFLL